MSKLFDAVTESENITITENGDKAFISTLSKVLDLFQDGFSYRRTPDKVREVVREAALEDKVLTLRCLFYLRDIHQGQGEREVFRTGMRTFLSMYPQYAYVVEYIPNGINGQQFGRWDDVIALLGISTPIDTIIFGLIYNQLINDKANHYINKVEKISLLAKWMPSFNTSSVQTRKKAKILLKGLQKVGTDHSFCSEKSYRKLLSMLRKDINILETKLTEKDYTFDYSQVPSLAMTKYRAAFKRNDLDRYGDYVVKLNAVMRGEADNTEGIKVNTATLYPYDVIKPIARNVHYNYVDTVGTIGLVYSGSEEEALLSDSQWRSLKNYFPEDGEKHNWLAVVDTSGSMYDASWCNSVASIEVAISLGLYMAEHNTGAFKNQLITFEEHPHFISFDDTWPIKEKVMHVASAPWGGCTDIRNVFYTLLDAAKQKEVPEEEMPETIVIISDMQFDSGYVHGSDKSAFEDIKEKYESAGYKMPKLVFWNACARYATSKPVLRHETGTILVGGCKPGILEQILASTTPEEMMMNVLNGERYNFIQ